MRESFLGEYSRLSLAPYELDRHKAAKHAQPAKQTLCLAPRARRA
jgi:hypothetical protein